MAYKTDFLLQLLEQTNHRCHLCGGGVTAHHYGCTIRRTGWEVDHDVPRARGGDDDPENLLPAHVSCNRSKRALPSDLVRAQNGLSRRPMSADEREDAQGKAVLGLGLLGAAGGGTIGAMIEGPEGDQKAGAAFGAFVGGLAGILLGALIDPED